MDERIKRSVEEAKKWLASSEVQKSLLETIKEAEEKGKKFSECRQIDPKLLNEPFTI